MQKSMQKSRTCSQGTNLGIFIPRFKLKAFIKQVYSVEIPRAPQSFDRLIGEATCYEQQEGR